MAGILWAQQIVVSTVPMGQMQPAATASSTPQPPHPAAISAPTWTLKNVSFKDGGVATGFFVYDATAGTVTNWDISVSGGSTSVFPPFRWTPGNSLGGWFPDASKGHLSFGSLQKFPTPYGVNEERAITFAFVSPLTNAGGTVTLDLTNTYAGECYNCAPFRLFAGGFVSTGSLAPANLGLISFPSPSIFGQAVTLTASLTPLAATGRVTFYDGTTVLGTRTVVGGQAVLTTALLASGFRSLRAYYGGDATYAATSATVTQTVNSVPGNAFAAAVNYGVGTNPISLVAGDFNGDGKADLAVANTGGNNVSVLLGSGKGAFQAAGSFGAGTKPFSLAAGDFNGDGRTDLAVANNVSNNVSVLLGNGNGTFQAAVNYGAGNGVVAVAVGDFNADGKADLAVANGVGSVSVLLGNGDGTFQAAVNYSTFFGSIAVTVGDFNGDGIADLAVANYNTSSLSVLLGNGNGTFQAAANYYITSSGGRQPRSLSVGDFNGDGRADLAIANESDGTVSILLGNGDGTFRAAVNYPAGNQPESVVVGDFNGDGRADLAVGNFDGHVSVLLGNGNGTFQAAAKFGAGSGPVSVAVGDFNGDGKADLAVANIDDNNVSVLLGALIMPSALALASSPNPSTFSQAITLTATVSPAGATGSVTFYDGATVLGTKTLAGGQATLTTSFLPSGARSLKAYYGGDASYAASTSAALAQTIRAPPQNGFLAAMNYSAGGGPVSVAVSDFNGDGKTDLAIANGGGQVTILLGSGNGAFQTAANYGVGNDAESVAVGDFNGDGKADLAVAGGNSVSVLIGNGNGSFQPAANYSSGGSGTRSVVVGDFNGDGKADLAVVSGGGVDAATGAGGVSIFFGSGDGTFQLAVKYGVLAIDYSVAVGDFNGDGNADLVVTNWAADSVVVLLGNGDGTFSGARYNTGRIAVAVAVGDFNADGKADLVVTNWGGAAM